MGRHRTKDLSLEEKYTKLAHRVSYSLKIDIVLDTMNILIKNTGGSLYKDDFIHSDQGSHYTSSRF